MNLITQTHLVPSLKMRTAILLLPFYTVMVWTVQLYLYVYSIKHFHLIKPFPVKEFSIPAPEISISVFRMWSVS